MHSKNEGSRFARTSLLILPVVLVLLVYLIVLKMYLIFILLFEVYLCFSGAVVVLFGPCFAILRPVVR